jgi:predicted short-subunit dehydrogenase-like oxidoreductase (DUF2520 family)
MEIVIIGSGNVASVLGRKAQQAGHEIVQVVSREPQHAKQLGDLLGASFGSLKDIRRSGFLYLVAITDQALLTIGEWLQLGNSVVAHTAGSISRDLLKDVSINYGVFWPLQSLRKEIDHIPDFPLIVDGNTPETLTLLQDLASSMSDRVSSLDDNHRMKLHLAASFSGNLSNHLYKLTYDFCAKEHLDFSLLLPLLQETVLRIDNHDPGLFQTGPAIRKDQVTMDKHRALLAAHPDMRKIYELMSDAIMQFHRGQ